MESLQQELINLIPTLIILIVLAAVAIFIFRRKPRDSGLMGLEELTRLKKKDLMTPEEIKRMRAAMARQYLEQEKETKEKQQRKGLSPIELLRLEAEKVDLNNVKKKTKITAHEHSGKLSGEQNQAVPIPGSLLPNASIVPMNTSDEKKLEAELPALNQKLRTYLGYPEAEWEALVQVGFLSPEDHQLLKQYRKKQEQQ